MFEGMMARPRATSPHKFAGDEIGDFCAPALPVALQLFLQDGAAKVFALRHIFHFGRDDAAAGIMHLADIRPGLGAQGRVLTPGRRARRRCDPGLSTHCLRA
jgi:hypothetical protein